MSYKCEKCKKQIKQGIPQCKDVKYRQVPIQLGESREEISSEKKICPKCASKVKNRRSNNAKKTNN